MRLFKSLSFGLVCSSVLAAAASAGPARVSASAPVIDKGSLPPISINTLGRVDAGTSVANASGESGGESECNPWWENGGYDGLNGLNSQELGGFEALVADDFFLQYGKCYFIDKVILDMAWFPANGALPLVKLRFYDDCNGKPAGQIWDELTASIEDVAGGVPNWPGAKLLRCTFVVDRFENGYRRVWLSPRGIGGGLYYWLTSGNGVIQGVQGQYRSAAYGFPDWTDVEPTECASCLPYCSDFNFTLCGKKCWLLKDNSNYDLVGLTGIAFANGLVFGHRAVDNFQVPPNKGSLEICRIEAWMATNCDTKRAFMEIYGNLCDTPTGPPIIIRDLKVEQLYENGSPVLLQPGNIPVYKFSTILPGVILPGGQNYWLAMAALGVGTPHERAIWLFKAKSACHINITEGQWRSDFFGFPDWTPVSHPDLAGEPRDFAFRIHVSEPKVPESTPPGNEYPVGPGSELGAVKVPSEGVHSGAVSVN